MEKTLKAKRILFMSSGILKCVISGFVVLLFGLALLLLGMLREGFLANTETINMLINELVAIEPKFEYLQSQPVAESVDFILGIVKGISIILLIMGVCGIALGIFNLLFAKFYKSWLLCNTKRKVIFTILTWLLYWEPVTNILTTVALYLRDRKKTDIKEENEE